MASSETTRVEVDLASHRVRIDSRASVELLRLALEEEGYPAAA